MQVSDNGRVIQFDTSEEAGLFYDLLNMPTDITIIEWLGDGYGTKITAEMVALRAQMFRKYMGDAEGENLPTYASRAAIRNDSVVSKLDVGPSMRRSHFLLSRGE